MQPRWKHILQDVKISFKHPISILDYGCGQELIVSDLLKAMKHKQIKIKHYTGIDCEREFIRSLRKLFKQYTFSTTMDIIRSYDVAFLVEVLEHLTSPDELNAALDYAKGATVYITYPNIKNHGLLNPREIGPGWWVGDIKLTTQYGHLILGHQWWTPDTFKSILETRGFKILDQGILPANNVYFKCK